MRYTRLGQTDLDVSRICFGTWQTGGDWGAVEEEDAIAAARRALDLGINFFDTAQAYGFGDSERLLAKSLELGSASRRSEVVVATKGGLRLEGDTMRRDSSRSGCGRASTRACASSAPTTSTSTRSTGPTTTPPSSSTATALDELVTEGKIRYVGVSNFDADEMADFERTRGSTRSSLPTTSFAATSSPRSCRTRANVESACSSTGRSHMDSSPASSTPAPSSPRATGARSRSVFSGEQFEGNVQIVKELGRFAEERGYTVGQLAVAWTLSNPVVDVAIVGARRPDHIDGTAPAGDIQLSDDDRQEIEEVIEGAVPVGGPSPEG